MMPVDRFRILVRMWVLLIVHDAGCSQAVFWALRIVRPGSLGGTGYQSPVFSLSDMVPTSFGAEPS